MKRHLFKREGFACWVTTRNPDDLLDLKTRTNKIGTWAKFFGLPNERAGKQQAKDLLARMCELMAHDMVVEHDAFILPRHDFGYMHIAALKPFMDTGHYPYDVRTDGIHFGGVIPLRPIIRACNGGKWYLFKLTQPWIKKIRELRAAGHYWAID